MGATPEIQAAFDVFERLSQVGDLLGGVGALLALLLTWLVYRGQKRLSRQLQSEQSAITKHLQSEQSSLTKQLHDQQQKFAQRQLLIPIWDHLHELRDINPQAPAWPSVINAVNKLELVALLVEGGVVEREVFRRALGRTFLHLCERINQVHGTGPTGKTGPQLLTDAPSVALLYEELRLAELNRDKLSPFQQ